MTNETTIINKRGHDPTDSERMARRRAVREQAARRDAELLPAVLAEADIAASENRCDQAADEHATNTAPLQIELSELEAAAIVRIADRLPADSERDARRAELVGLIAEATVELEVVVAREREIQGVARQKARRIRQGHPPPDTILAALAKPPAASPRLLAEAHVARERVRWLQARRQAAEKALKIHAFNAAEIRGGRTSGDLGVFLGKVAAWERERDAVGQELAEAMTEGQRVYQEILAE